MDTPENVPAPEPTPVAKPVFRAGTSCDIVANVALSIKGDFNHKDLVNAVHDFALKNKVDAGVIDRNCRHVVSKLLKANKLTKVRRGRWIVV